MNLNQAAHGDREFGYIQTRLGVARKTVVGHVSNPAVLTQVESWQRAAAGWAASRSAQARPFRRQHALRRRHRGRQDRGRAAVRRAGQHVGRERTRRRGRRGIRRRRRCAHRRVPRGVRRGPGAATGRGPAPVPARRRGDRARPALLPRGGRLRRLHDQLRGPRRAEAAARARGAAAHGRRLRLRRRGRLEDRDPGPRRERDGRRPARWREPHGGLHLRPRPGQRAHPRRAHARGLAVAHHRQAARWRSTRSASAARTTRCAWSSPPTPAPPSWSR